MWTHRDFFIKVLELLEIMILNELTLIIKWGFQFCDLFRFSAYKKRVNWWDKRILLWTKTFAKESDIPEYIDG